MEVRIARTTDCFMSSTVASSVVISVSTAAARNIEDFNKHLPATDEQMPYIVVIIDELADLMMLAPDDTERVITIEDAAELQLLERPLNRLTLRIEHGALQCDVDMCLHRA